MGKSKRPVKAYKNAEFLNSAEARTIRILSEYYEPKSRFEKNNIIDTIVFFGSARIISRRDALKLVNAAKKQNTPAGKRKFDKAVKLLEMSKYYEDAVELSKKLTLWSKKLDGNGNRFIICTGGGPGIMEAANKGAYLAGGHSIGLNISIPYEQFVNKYVDNKLAFEFHYFFMRKLWFMYLAKALIVFPGGFGTMDELMEVLTLVQTKKVTKKMKIIIYDEAYWKEIINFDALIEHGTISKEDMKLFDFCNTVDEAFDKITTHFKKHFLNQKGSLIENNGKK
ncbi:TIGR00730 family Rossman fold protein [Melioribacter sp. Ez-97]|uniref:LOG family protein n=1 Tax=Melioribacter sp. Ez-97 TaxID=3423434 RepID=UPI003EDA747E